MSETGTVPLERHSTITKYREIYFENTYYCDLFVSVKKNCQIEILVYKFV